MRASCHLLRNKSHKLSNLSRSINHQINDVFASSILDTISDFRAVRTPGRGFDFINFVCGVAGGRGGIGGRRFEVRKMSLKTVSVSQNLHETQV